MSKRVRTLGRNTGHVDPSARSQPLVPKPADPRQPDLFAPTFIPPCKPKLSAKVPVGDPWQYEFKHDGYRLQAHLDHGRVVLFTKNGHDWTGRCPGIAAALQQLRVRSAILDGEAVIESSLGISDFFALHAAAAKGRAPTAMLYAFDLLELDGEDLRPAPLVERRALLAETLVGSPDGVEMSPHVVERGEDVYRYACSLGLEGIVAKRQDAPYKSGYVETWLKVKCTQTDAFAVIGCERVGRSGLRALQVATLKEGELVRAGWVGAGLSEKSCREVRAALDAGKPVVIDVEFRGWTPAGELRHPVFKSWHEG